MSNTCTCTTTVAAQGTTRYIVQEGTTAGVTAPRALGFWLHFTYCLLVLYLLLILHLRCELLCRVCPLTFHLHLLLLSHSHSYSLPTELRTPLDMTVAASRGGL